MVPFTTAPAALRVDGLGGLGLDFAVRVAAARAAVFFRATLVVVFRAVFRAVLFLVTRLATLSPLLPESGSISKAGAGKGDNRHFHEKR
jgi:hypothetical protein